METQLKALNLNNHEKWENLHNSILEFILKIFIMNDFEEFSDKLMENVTSNLTDIVFQIIENDRELLHDYMLLLQNNKLNVLNSNIAKMVKKRFNLSNADLRNAQPKSKLIQSYQEFD